VTALPAWAALVRADNPGPMTLEGTNTYVVRAPAAGGHADAIVVDPGPLDELHLAAVVAAADGHVGLVLLTHGHPDHSAGALLLQEMTGAPMAAADPRFCVDAEPLRAGTQLDGVAGLDVHVLATPGHTADSVSFLVHGDQPGLLTGDTILGRGTTVVAWPDGSLEAYLASLERIEALTRAGSVTSLLPGHGPFVADAAATVTFYLKHRAERLDQVRDAVARGAHTAYAVVEQVYADVPRSVWPAAELSVHAQLEYLREHG
jgi:glyoxylase-like metal-dependent hydrolase (beta-lactamase superfamily II)